MQTETRPHRRLRVYSREGALQSTAEPVPGLEHGCAWRPSGGLIASTQRFGRVPGSADADGGLGQGRDGRHDVVFFERNGLRHGEFALREKVDGPGSESRRWGYRAREVGWSADSNVLSVWLERDDGDVGASRTSLFQRRPLSCLQCNCGPPGTITGVCCCGVE